MKKNIQYIKYLKVFAILMVCSYHYLWATDVFVNSYDKQNQLSMLLYSMNTICVPIFFMCNGALLLNKKMNLRKHMRLVLKLLITYFVFSFFLLIIYLRFNLISISAYGVKKIINFVLLNGNSVFQSNHLWFIRTLVSLYIIFPFIKIAYDFVVESRNKDYKNLSIVFLIVILVLSETSQLTYILQTIFPRFNGITLYTLKSFFPFNGQLNMMVLYFVVGGYLHNKYYVLRKQNDILLVRVLFMYTATTVTTFLLWKYSMSYPQWKYDVVFDNYGTILGFLTSVSFFLIIMKLDILNYINENILISLISDNTLEIYYIHWIIGQTVLLTIYPKVLSLFNNKVNYSINLLKSITLVIIISSSSWLVKKIMFKLIKKVKKIGSYFASNREII